MADQSRQGEDWDDGELDAIVADYFAMLGDELAQRPYVKAQHRADLMQLIGRSAASMEFKYRNISAVLQEMGSPWIWGYKPALNYQDALSDAVDRYLTGHREVIERQPVPLIVPGLDVVFTTMPVMVPRQRGKRLERLVRKFDPVERDFRNRQLGRAGEGVRPRSRAASTIRPRSRRSRQEGQVGGHGGGRWRRFRYCVL
jgi:hypothetical protein